MVARLHERLVLLVREHMARLGFRTMQEMVGHVEALDTRSAVDHWKAQGLDISPILAVPQNPYGQTRHQSVGQDHELEHALASPRPSKAVTEFRVLPCGGG